MVDGLGQTPDSSKRGVEGSSERDGVASLSAKASLSSPGGLPQTPSPSLALRHSDPTLPTDLVQEAQTLEETSLDDRHPSP